MTHPFVAEWRDLPARSGPWMDVDPTPSEPCTNPACVRAIAAERRIQHALADADVRQRAEIHALEARVAELTEDVHRLTREKGDAT